MYISILFLFFTAMPDTTAATQPQQQDLTSIRMMVLEGDIPDAIAQLEVLEKNEQAGKQALALLLNLYQQEFRYHDAVSLFGRNTGHLHDMEDAVVTYAQARLQLGYQADAKAVLEGYREREPGGTKALILLGKLYYDGREWPAALPVYEEIEEKIPGNFLFNTQRARILTMLGEESSAVRILEHVLDNQPEFMPAMLQLIQLYYSLGEMETAKELAERGIQAYPGESRFRTLAGRIAYANELYETAAAHWNAVVELGNATSETFRGLGLCYYELGQSEPAIRNFNNALAFNPDDTIALLYSAMVHRREGEWAKTRQILNRLYDLHTSDYLRDIMMQRAVAHEELGDIGAAEEDYKRAMNVFPDHAEAAFYLAVLYDRHNSDYNVALSHYRDYLSKRDIDTELEEYARGRVRYLTERLHFQQGREASNRE